MTLFSSNSVSNLSLSEGSPAASALVAKLADLDKGRIHSTDDLILRKAVFGLLEVVSLLESRVAELEGVEASSAWTERISQAMGMPTPDQLRLGEIDE